MIHKRDKVMEVNDITLSQGPCASAMDVIIDGAIVVGLHVDTWSIVNLIKYGNNGRINNHQHISYFYHSLNGKS